MFRTALILYLFCKLSIPETTLDTVKVLGRSPKLPASRSDDLGVISVEIPPADRNEPLRALAREPAVQALPLNSDRSMSFSIRGSDPEDVRIFLEGLSLTDAEFNASHIQFLPSAALRQIDLYPDMVPLRFVSDGTGSALHFGLGDYDDPTWEIQSRVGAFQNYRLGARGGLARGVGSAWEFQRSQEDFPYLDDKGTPFNSMDDERRFREHNGFLKGSGLVWGEKRAGEHRLFVAALLATQATEIPESGTRAADLRLQQSFGQALFRHEMGFSDGNSVQTQFFYRILSEDLKAETNASRGAETQTYARSLGGQTNWTSKNRWGRWESHLAIRHHDYHRSDLSSEISASRSEFALGLGQRFEGEKWKIRPGLLGITAQDGNETRSFLSPRMEAEVDLGSGSKLKGYVGRLSRLPTLSELGGAGRALLGNPGLVREVANRLGVGLESGWMNLGREWETQGFYHYDRSHADNLIVLLPNTRSEFRPVNIGASRIDGQEIGLRIRWKTDWVWRNSLVLLKTENLSDIAYQRGRELPGRFPWRWYSDLSYQRDPWRITYRLSRFSESYTDLANEQRLSGYWRHDISVLWETVKWGSWGLELENLLDTATADVYSAGKSYMGELSGFAGQPVSGRRWYLKWSYEF